MNLLRFALRIRWKLSTSAPATFASRHCERKSHLSKLDLENHLGQAISLCGSAALSFVIPPSPACRGACRRGICSSLSASPKPPLATSLSLSTALPLFVIPRGCDFFDFSCFWYTPPECFSELPQNRHPERSASRIYRLTEGLQRVVEGPRGCLLADALHSFPATKTMREIKNHNLRAKPTCPGVPWRDLRFRGPLLETRILCNPLARK
jgi:hypothetical protein